jgi:hypothetical protein
MIVLRANTTAYDAASIALAKAGELHHEPSHYAPETHKRNCHPGKFQRRYTATLLLSLQMGLPGAENAVVDVQKLRDYCLNPMHPRGRHKARVFASALGLQREDAESLRTQLLEAALKFAAIATESDEYGQRYTVDFDCVRANRRARIRSSWIVRPEEAFPRLTTCYVLSN